MKTNVVLRTSFQVANPVYVQTSDKTGVVRSEVGTGEAGSQDVVGEVELFLSYCGGDHVDVEDNGKDGDEDEEVEESRTIADSIDLLM